MNNQAIQLAIPYTFDLVIDRDHDLAQMYYDEFLAETNAVKFSDNHGLNMLILGDTEQLAFTKTFLNKSKKADLIELANLVFDNFYYYDNDTTKAELIEELADTTMVSYIQALVNEYGIWRGCDELDSMVDFISRGYSQGDAVKVIILNDKQGSYDWIDSEYVDNVLWDSPIYARLNITDNITGESEEIYLDEYLDGIYSYDKDELLAAIKDSSLKQDEAFEHIIEYLEQELPEYI